MSGQVYLGKFGKFYFYYLELPGNGHKVIFRSSKKLNAIRKHPRYFYLDEIVDQRYYKKSGLDLKLLKIGTETGLLFLEWEKYGQSYKEAHDKYKKFLIFK